MPEFLGDILVVSKDELIPKFWSCYNSLKTELRRYKEKPYGIKRASLGGNGRKLLIKYDSLPKRVQDQIKDLRKSDHILEKYYKVDPEAVEYYNGFQYPDGSYLVPATIEKLIINANVLLAIMNLETARSQERISKGGSLRGITQTLHSDSISFNTTLQEKEQTKHTLNTNYRRFKQQLKSFKDAFEISSDHAFKTLIRDAEGKSKLNALIINDKTAALLNNMFAGRPYKPTATEIAREYAAFINGHIDIINKKTGELYNPKEYKMVKKGAIKNFLRSYKSKIGTFSKRSSNRQQILQQFVPYDTLEQPKFAGSMISIDDRQPPFWYDKGKRMWWYLGIDLASECITAWAYGKTKEELILNFYRQMVRNYHQWGMHIPDALECESSLNSSFKETILKEGVMFNNVHIHANSARSKRIEGYFKPLRYQVEKKQEGWIARPFALSESNQPQYAQNKIVPYDRLVEQCFRNIIKWNNMANSQDKTLSRFDYFKKHQNPDLTPTNYKAIIKHLGYSTETSCNAGIVRLQNRKWLLGDNDTIYTGEKLITLLNKVEGKSFEVCWLDDNSKGILKAYVYVDGRYVCQIIPKPVSAKAPIEAKQHHKDASVIMARYKATVTSYMQIQKNSIDTVTLIDNRPETISDSFSIEGFESFEIPDLEEPAELPMSEVDYEDEYYQNLDPTNDL
ncbi:hypothetical protein [Pseudotenacibaculum haliotis]|uniref:Integrase catalytic domain-containing protein n=1 Tax=Pseudotenacibaculum haliotis TaxID=1862138 RepID=A0ABW5LMM8_9FLAO